MISSARSASAAVDAPKLADARRRLLDRLHDRREGVAQDHRSPGAEVVDVAVAVRVPQVRAFGARDEWRIAADGAKGADRRVDAAGEELFGALLQLAGAIEFPHRFQYSDGLIVPDIQTVCLKEAAMDSLRDFAARDQSGATSPASGKVSGATRCSVQIETGINCRTDDPSSRNPPPGPSVSSSFCGLLQDSAPGRGRQRQASIRPPEQVFPTCGLVTLG